MRVVVEAASRAWCVAENIDPDRLIIGEYGEAVIAWRYMAPSACAGFAAGLRALADDTQPSSFLHPAALRRLAADLDRAALSQEVK